MRLKPGLLFAVLIFFASTHPAHAVPAYPGEVEATQPDGAKFKLRMHGDEHYSWHETPEGYAIKQDRADGFWKYARPAAGQADFAIVPGARVGRSDPARLNLRRKDMPDRELPAADHPGPAQGDGQRRPPARGTPDRRLRRVLHVLHLRGFNHSPAKPDPRLRCGHD